MTLHNLAKVYTTTTGSGIVTLGATYPGFLGFIASGVVNGETVSYGILDGWNSEVGTGVYTHSGSTLSRNVIKSTNTGSPISLSGSAILFITALAEDIGNVRNYSATTDNAIARFDGITGSFVQNSLVTIDDSGIVILPSSGKLVGITQNFIDIDRCGFLNQLQTTIGFDGSSVFTLGDSGSGWSYYRSGIKYNISGSKTVALSGSVVPPSTGNYYIYIDDTTGSLISSISPWTLQDSKIPVSIIYWNNSLTPKYIIAEERHSCLIDRRVHLYEHDSEGTKFISGGGLSSLVPTSDNDVSKRVTIASTIIADEDIFQTLATLTPAGSPYTATDYFVAYRSTGSTWLWKQSAMPFAYNTVTNFIQYDSGSALIDGNGGAGGNARWYNSYILFTNQQGSSRYTIVPGRGSFTTLALAQAENPVLFDWTGLNISEAVIAWQLTWAIDSAGYTSLGKCVYKASKKINIGFTSVASSGIGIDHNTLAGIQGGNSGLNEYYHVSGSHFNLLGTTGSSSFIPNYSNVTTQFLNGSGSWVSGSNINAGAIGGYTSGSFVKLAGDTMTGALNVFPAFSGADGVAVYVNSSISNTTASNFLDGVVYYVTKLDTTDLGTLRGVQGITFNGGSAGNIGLVIGGVFANYITGGAGATGVISDSRGLSIGSPYRGAGNLVTVTNQFGAVIENQGASFNGASFGIYMASQTGSGANYAIYTQGGLNVLGDQLNVIGSADRTQLVVTGNATQTTPLATFMGGNVGIGTTTPLAKLDVGGIVNVANLPTVLGVKGTTQLGGTAGDYAYPFEVQNTGPNIIRLQMVAYKRTTTATWDGTSYRLQYALDGSFTDGSKSYVEIGASDPNSSYGGFISLGTEGVDRLSVTSAGNVGIGTNQPNYRLHVWDSANIGTIALGNVLYPGLLYANAGTGEFRIDNRASSTAGFISFYPNGETTVGSEKMRITTSGNVGIGTTAPDVPLHIQSPSALNPTLGAISGSLYINYGTYGVFHGLNVSSGNGWIQVMEEASAVAYDLLLQPVGGRVGIGTTGPGFKLDVAGTVRVGNGSNFATNDGGILLYSNNAWKIGFDANGAAPYAIRYNVDTADSAHGHVFSAGAIASPTHLMTIRGDGNVGIGTTAPIGALHTKEGEGYFLLKYVAIPSGTPIVIIPDAAGDITGICLIATVTVPSSGASQTLGDTTMGVGGGVTIYNDGAGNTVAVAVSAGGALTINRSGGTKTYKVMIRVMWI